MEKDRLQDHIRQLYPLPDEEMQAFTSGWKPLTIKRKTMLTVPGEKERYLYFVLEGVQRAFYLLPDGREATVVFTYAPSFSGVADSFLTQSPSLYFLETITASSFLRITYDEIDQLMKSYPVIREMILNLTAINLKAVLFRQVELQAFSNEEKFRTLMTRSPHLLHLVPHKYIASYLGMDATNFSKLLGSGKL